MEGKPMKARGSITSKDEKLASMQLEKTSGITSTGKKLRIM